MRCGTRVNIIDLAYPSGGISMIGERYPHNEGKIHAYTPYTVRCATQFDRVLTLMANLKSTAEYVGSDTYHTEFDDIDHRQQIVQIDPTFMKGLGHIAFGLYKELVRVDEKETADDIKFDVAQRMK